MLSSPFLGHSIIQVIPLLSLAATGSCLSELTRCAGKIIACIFVNLIISIYVESLREFTAKIAIFFPNPGLALLILLAALR